MIYFDLDGVLRDLCAAAGISPSEWDCQVDGVDLVEYFNENIHKLATAPPTKYLEAVKAQYSTLNILSYQPKQWLDNTSLWLAYHVPGANFKCLNIGISKLDYLDENDILVEDYPFFTDYSKVIVVDKPYNRNIKLSHTRVDTPIGLIVEIERRMQWQQLCTQQALR